MLSAFRATTTPRPGGPEHAGVASGRRASRRQPLPRPARGSLLVVALAAALALPAAAEEGRRFSVLHFTDIHVGPYLAKDGAPGPVRGHETLAWLCAEAVRSQAVAPDFTAPPPAAAIATGDLTEYGVIDDTWGAFERALAGLPCPLHVLPGNHDNTWTALYAVLRARHGGTNHSFDVGGCHFVCLSSASPQEPVPSLDAATRTWLKADLQRLPPHTPVFVALHHPLYSAEFANPAEQATMIDLLRDYNVVLLLYGHGHSVDARDNGGLPGVMGGSTFGKNAGYGLLAVDGDRVRYAYRHHRALATQPAEREQSEWKVLWEARIPAVTPPRVLDIAAPAPDAAASDETLVVTLKLRDAAHAQDGLVATVAVADREPLTIPLDAAEVTARVPLAGLLPGAHLLHVRVRPADADPKKTPPLDVRTRVFHVERPSVRVLWRQTLPAAVKAGPMIAGARLIVARNDGVVAAHDRRSGAVQWSVATGGEVLATPACADGVVVFGSGDGRVYAVDDAGAERWRYDAGAPVYGEPRVADGTVYIADNAGRLHALSLRDGARQWVFERADYGSEGRPAIWGDLVVFGAWDGRLYALERADGRVRWSSAGPKSSDGGAARYFAPADCGPVALDDVLLVCDRGYLLGAYDRTGRLVEKWPLKVAALTPTADGRGAWARTTETRVLRLNERGAVVREVDVPAGRFPVPPTEAGGRLYVCSNHGQLSVLAAADGRKLWAYQATPGFFVMAPVAVDDAGVCYVAGMDGTLVAVRGRAEEGTQARSHEGTQGDAGQGSQAWSDSHGDRSIDRGPVTDPAGFAGTPAEPPRTGPAARPAAGARLRG